MSDGLDGGDPTSTTFIRRLKARDEESWRVFYEQHRNTIYLRAISRGLNEAEAEEVVQETFLTVLRKIDEFVYDPALARKGGGKLAGFVTQTANWRIEDQRDQRLPVSAPPRVEDVGQTEFIHRVPDQAVSPEGELAGKEKTQLAGAAYESVMHRIKERTSPRQFQVYEMHHLRGCTVEEVCQALNVKPQDVYNASLRIQRRVQEEIEKLRSEIADVGGQGNTVILRRCLDKRSQTRPSPTV